MSVAEKLAAIAGKMREIYDTGYRDGATKGLPTFDLSFETTNAELKHYKVYGFEVETTEAGNSSQTVDVSIENVDGNTKTYRMYGYEVTE